MVGTLQREKLQWRKCNASWGLGAFLSGVYTVYNAVLCANSMWMCSSVLGVASRKGTASQRVRPAAGVHQGLTHCARSTGRPTHAAGWSDVCTYQRTDLQTIGNRLTVTSIGAPGIERWVSRSYTNIYAHILITLYHKFYEKLIFKYIKSLTKH